MNKTDVSKRLRAILEKCDIDPTGILNRKVSIDHDDAIGVLINHIEILFQYLQLDAEASRREVFALRKASGI
jgi:hypothetical protein